MTYSLIAANVIVFLCLLPLGPVVITSNFGLSPSHASMLYILTSMFVHVNPLHLLWNMLFLWLFGPSVEDVLGRVRFTGLYILSGFIAAMLHAFIVRNFMPAFADVPVIGASGAIAGILGVFAVRFYRTGIRVFWWLLWRCGSFTIPAKFGLGIWFIQQFAGGVFSVLSPLLPETSFAAVLGHRLFGDGVSYWSHIGGMGFGTAVAFLLGLQLEGTKEYLLDDARVSMERGSTWHAAEHLSAVLACDPENADVHASLAMTYAMQQDADLAVAHYQKAIELFLKREEFEKAISSFIELRSFYRHAEIGLHYEFQLARHMDEADRHEHALQLFKEIIAEHPDTPEAEVSLVRVGSLYLNKLANPKEAVSCFDRFLKEYPNSSWRTLVSKSLIEAREKSRLENNG
jgi:membrane associated rhomboid family serine protease